jgi:DNA/RNA endonuclease YhcR with UshA esterase domain
LRAKINLVEEREQLYKANRVALEEIERRKLEIQSEEQRLIEQIETTQETFKLKKQLAEKEARVSACTRFEKEDMSVIFDDDDNQCNATREHIQRFLQSQAEPSAEGENNELVTHDTANSPPPESGLLVPPQSQLDSAVPPYVPCKEATTSAPAPNQQSNVTPTNAHINPPYTLTGAANSDLVQELTAITKLLEVQNQNRLPLAEPGVFSGNPLQYPMWVKAFETLIEGRAINPAERLHFLGKYVIGEAKEVVKLKKW